MDSALLRTTGRLLNQPGILRLIGRLETAGSSISVPGDHRGRTRLAVSGLTTPGRGKARSARSAAATGPPGRPGERPQASRRQLVQATATSAVVTAHTESTEPEH